MCRNVSQLVKENVITFTDRSKWFTKHVHSPYLWIRNHITNVLGNTHIFHAFSVSICAFMLKYVIIYNNENILEFLLAYYCRLHPPKSALRFHCHFLSAFLPQVNLELLNPAIVKGVGDTLGLPCWATFFTIFLLKCPLCFRNKYLIIIIIIYFFRKAIMNFYNF
jgi:hypothetical protein